MAQILTDQDFQNAKIDIEDIGQSVNESMVITPRYGAPYKSIPMLSAEAQVEINNWLAAIQLITQQNGIPALAVSDASGQNQQQINNRLSLQIESVADLVAYEPRYVGEVVELKSYIAGKNLGGSDLVCVQSNLLIENGVTIFKSTVFGYNDHFWVRINYDELNVEMAGALPDPTFNSRDAFHRCTKLGGSYVMQGEYWAAHPQDSSSTRVIPYYDKPITFYSKNKNATLYCTHTFATESPYAIGIGDFNLRCPLLVLKGVEFQGHKTAGHLPKNERCWTVEVRGCDAYWIQDNTFSTFNGHSLFIARQAHQTWFTTDPNTSESVLALNALNSKNGVVEGNHFEHVGSTPCGVFGASNLHFRRNTVNISGALYAYLMFTDDASSQTALTDYCTNDNVFVYDNIAPDAEIRFDGCVSGYVKNNTVNLISYRTYDFDQQKNNFDSGTHTYNPNDHLSTPFLWMKYLRRNVEISGNNINKLEIRGAFVYHHDNHYTSTANGVTLINVARNSVVWGTGVSYYDDIDESGNIRNSESHDNTFVLNHNGCYCSRYDATFPFTYYSMLESKIYRISDSITFTHMLYPNSRHKRDSYTVIEVSYSSNVVNHPMEVRHTMLTQGIGKNYLKTFTNVRGGQGAQPLYRFTSTTDVHAHLHIVSDTGLILRKKITVTGAGVMTVGNLDGITSWDTGVFSLTTLGDGSRQITSNTASGLDYCIDIQAVGGFGDTVFIMPETRLETTG